MSSCVQEVTHHPTSDDENTEEEERIAYSSTVHKLITFTNVGAIGLLQVVTNQPSTNKADDRGATILCFCVFTLTYVVLRVLEVKLRKNPKIRDFVGHVSHLFGALPALMLISLISPSFTLFAVPLWLVWLFVVMYVSFSGLVFPEENAADSPV